MSALDSSGEGCSCTPGYVALHPGRHMVGCDELPPLTDRRFDVLMAHALGWEKTLNTPGKMHDHKAANCPACALRDNMRALIREMGGVPS